MKRLVVAVGLLLLLTACTNPFSNSSNKEEAAGQPESKSESTGPTVYSYNFTLDQEVNPELDDLVSKAISKRMAVFGYPDAEITVNNGKDISIKFKAQPGVIFLDDKFIAFMLNTPTFEVRVENDAKNLVLTEEEKKNLEEYNKQVKDKANEVLKIVLAEPDKFAELAKEYSQDPGSKDNGGSYKGVTKGQFVPEYEDVIFNKIKTGDIYGELLETKFGYHIIKKDAETGEGDNRVIDTSHILFAKKTEAELLAAKRWVPTGLSGLYIDKVEPYQQAEDSFAFKIIFDQAGADLLSQISKDNQGKPLAIIINNTILGTPVLDGELNDGVLIITGKFTKEGVIAISQQLNGGVLPSRIRLAEQPAN